MSPLILRHNKHSHIAGSHAVVEVDLAGFLDTTIEPQRERASEFKREEASQSKLLIILPSVIVPCIIIISLLVIYFRCWKPRRRRQGLQREKLPTFCTDYNATNDVRKEKSNIYSCGISSKPAYNPKDKNAKFNFKEYNNENTKDIKNAQSSEWLKESSHYIDLDLYDVPRLTLRLSHSEFLPWNDLFARSAGGHGILADEKFNVRSSSLKRKAVSNKNKDGTTKKEYKSSNLSGRTDNKENDSSIQRDSGLDKATFFHRKSRQSKVLMRDMVKEILDILPYSGNLHQSWFGTESQNFEATIDHDEWESSYRFLDSVYDVENEDIDGPDSEQVPGESDLYKDMKLLSKDAKKEVRLLPDPISLPTVSKSELESKALPSIPSPLRTQKSKNLEDSKDLVPLSRPITRQLSTYSLNIIMESLSSSTTFNFEDNENNKNSELALADTTMETKVEGQRRSIFESLFDSPTDKKLPQIPQSDPDYSISVPPWELPNYPALTEQMSSLYVVSYSYVPKLPDEILIARGEVVSILKEYDDGWCLVKLILKSTSQGDLIENNTDEEGMCPKGCINRLADRI